MSIVSRLIRIATTIRESVLLAVQAMWSNRARSLLAIFGVVIGIVTVVLVASVLANVRNQVALLFRELGTNNIFAFHLSGDPYSQPSEREISRRPLRPEFAKDLALLADSISQVAVQLLVPQVSQGRALTARAAGYESDTVLVEGVSANFFDVVGAEFASGRPFTQLEERSAARVAVIGSNLAQALFPSGQPLGKKITLAGGSYFVVGRLAPRKGGFFGENRQDNVLAVPSSTAQRRFNDADRTILYIQAEEGMLDQAQQEAEFVLRQLRNLRPDQPNDFNLSTAESIIRGFDAVSAQIALVTVALAAVSLVIGGIGIANVMIISVTERTREIGVRLAIGARRRDVLLQFLLEAGFLSVCGGILGVALSLGLGLLLKLVLTGSSAVPPAWAVGAGIASALIVGLVAGFLPARRASRMDPVEALRHV